MADLGPAKWPDDGGVEILTEGMALNGYFLEGRGKFPSMHLQAGSGSTHHTTVSNRSIVQRKSIGGDQPLSMRPYNATVAFQMVFEEDMWKFKEADAASELVKLFVDRPMVDRWYIPAKRAGQTIWKSSRVSAWGLTGISSTNRPVAVYIDGVEQTAAASPPAAGQYSLADPGEGNHLSLELPSTISGTYLTLRYVPQLQVLITAFAETNSQHNDYRFSVSIRELFTNDYAGANE